MLNLLGPLPTRGASGYVPSFMGEVASQVLDLPIDANECLELFITGILGLVRYPGIKCSSFGAPCATSGDVPRQLHDRRVRIVC